MSELVVAKYQLPIQMEADHVRFADSFTMQLPAGAQPLRIYANKDDCVLYVLVDRDAPLEERNFRLVQTGIHKLDGNDHLYYLGSFGANDGKLIFHLFERILETVRVTPSVVKKVH